MKPKPEKVGLRYVPLSQVRRWPRNPKHHDIPRIQSSIRRHGFVLPLVEDGTSGMLVAGHGRLESLALMFEAGESAPRRILVRGGEWQVPVLSGVSFPDEAAAERYLLADNRLVELGGWDARELLAMFESHTPEFVHQDLGWSPAEVTRLRAELEPSRRGSTPVEQLPKFQSAAIKQVVLYFSSADFPQVTARLQRVSASLGVDNNTDVFRRLLDFHEKNYDRARPGPRRGRKPQVQSA